MITLHHLTLRRGQKVLLEDIDLAIYAKQKIGLIGDNGCGKSSFFAMLKNELEPYQGTLFIPNGLEIAEVKQEIPTSSQSAMEYVIDGDHHYRRIEKILRTAEKCGDAKTMAHCHDELANMDGYAIKGKAEKILRGLGFKGNELEQPTQAFSGGWRMRLNLAQALMSRANLMLLDEPTNHLDLDAIIWLEKWLQEYSGTLLVISHDREFLDNTINAILHFNDLSLKLYRGNYSSFEKQQAEQLMVQQATFEKQQAQIAHMQSFINRFKAKASKARQAQSRIKALEKIQLVAAVKNKSKIKFSFKQPKECPNPLVRIEQAAIGYDVNNAVLTGVDIQFAPSDRIGLLGINGAGKTTLVKTLAGIQPPLSGTVHFYKGIKIGYFAQHQIEHLDLQRSPLELLQHLAPKHTEQELRTFLGNFDFSGDMAISKVELFSGGEKARLALALIIWQAPNLLLLDEPTNHLDINMREALILALQEYSGALILVSHDRYLIRTTTDELMLIADKKLQRFSGDLDDYRKLLLEKNNREKDTSQLNQIKINPGKEKRKLETQLVTVEKEMSALQKQKADIDNLLSNPTLYEKEETENIKKYFHQQATLTQKITELEQLWLSLLEKMEHYPE